jgi:hypothetical protein
MRIRKAAATAMLVGVSVAGGAAGTAWLIGTPASAATSPAPSASTDAPDSSTPNGTFHSNEDPTHEKGESAAREAQEDAGQRPTQP